MLKKGSALVKETGLRSFLWSKRYLELTDTMLLVKKSSSAPPVQEIYLSTIERVERVQQRLCCIEIEHQGRTCLISFKSDEELYSWLDEIYLLSVGRRGISTPTNFQHHIHVGYDPAKGFTGLPKEWERLLSTSKITREDMSQNPQTVLDVLEFYTDLVEEEQLIPVPLERTLSEPTSRYISRKDMLTSFPKRPVVRRDTVKERSVSPPPPARPSSPGISREVHSPVPRPSGAASQRDGPPKGQPLQLKDLEYQLPPIKVMPTTNEYVQSSSGSVHTLGSKTKKSKKYLNDSEMIEQLKRLVSHNDPFQIYSKIRKVGQGASAVVYIGRNIHNNSRVAIKQLDLLNQPRKDLLVNEITVLKELRKHENIIEFIDAFLVKSDLWIVMEYIEHGTLTDIISKQTLSEPHMAAILEQVFGVNLDTCWPK
jgi:protein-serine/threonine kinase